MLKVRKYHFYGKNMHHAIYILSVFSKISGREMTQTPLLRTSMMKKVKLELLLSDLYTLHPSQIVMYTTEYCSDCLRAKAFFEANKIEYQTVGLEANKEATEFVLRVNNGKRSVPTIVFPDGSILVEPSWKELQQKTQPHNRFYPSD